MKIEQWPPARCRPYAKNPRQNAGAVDAVAESIRRFGFQQPIVVDRKGVIVVGHTRHAAAIKLGLKTVPVHVAKNLTPKQARAYRLADNKTNVARWEQYTGRKATREGAARSKQPGKKRQRAHS